MAKIIRFHGLTPIPVEVDIDTLSPRIEDIEAAITPKTKVFLFLKIGKKKKKKTFFFFFLKRQC